MSPSVPHSPPPEFDHASSLLAMSPPPVFGREPSPFINRSTENMVRVPSLLSYTTRVSFLQPISLPRTYKDDEGQKHRPGLRDLPDWLQDDFRNLFIRRIIERVCLSKTPWTNPTLQLLQRELNLAYRTRQLRLHSDDAAVIPVSSSYHHAITTSLQSPQTLRDLGVLRNQIGSEGLAAVLEYLPGQFTKRMINSKDARAKYVAAVLAEPQRPFIWEYFRPGTIPLPGERAYYDEVCSCCGRVKNRLTEPLGRNGGDHSNQILYSMRFRSILPLMESKCRSQLLILATDSARLVPWLSQLRR